VADKIIKYSEKATDLFILLILLVPKFPLSFTFTHIYHYAGVVIGDYCKE
jgi:hypothetical protein